MKEAAGEANMTVITIVLIAGVLAIGTIIVGNVMKNVGRKSNTTATETTGYDKATCTKVGGSWSNGQCSIN